MRISYWSSDVLSSGLQVGESAVVVEHGGVALQDERAIVGLDSLVPATGAVVQQADAVPGPPERRIESHGALQRELGRLLLALQQQGDAAALLRPGRRLRSPEERRVGKEGVRTCRARGALCHKKKK